MDFPLPELGEGVYEAELVRWLVKPGDMVKRGQALMEVMTDKATMEVPSPFAGSVTHLRAEPGVMVKVGDVVLTYQGAAAPGAATGGESRKQRDKTLEKPSGSAKDSTRIATRTSALHNGPNVPIKAAPSVRYMARKLGIDINRVQGSGPQGRILIEDLGTQIAQESTKEASPVVKPDYGTPGTRIKLQGLRRVIAERMVKSKHTI